MSMVGFPLLLIPLAIYNILVLLMPGVSLADPLFKLTLMSGSDWPVTMSDILLALGILMLLLEVIKGARPGAKYLTDHLLSLIVFGGAAAEFLLWPKFASSTYFLLTLLALADFASGIALRARRGMQLAPAVAVSRRATQTADVQADTKADIRPVEPRFEPEPSPPPAPSAPPAAPVPAAASVAESVLLDHPEPKTAQPAVVASEPSPPAVAASEPEPVVAAEPEPVVVVREPSAADGFPGAAAEQRRAGLARDAASAKSLNNLPHPGSCALHSRRLLRSVGGERIRSGGTPQAPRLREMLGGCDQLRDEGRVGRRSTHLRVRPLGLLCDRHQRDASRLCVLKDAVVCRMRWSIRT